MTPLYQDGQATIEHIGKAAPGHLQIRPVKQVQRLDQLSKDEVAHLFMLANVASTAAYELLGAQGSNIIVTESDGSLIIEIIARSAEDGLNFMWEPKKVPDPEMTEIARRIKDAIVIGEQPSQSISAPAQKHEQKIEVSKSLDRTNYLIEQLRRLP